MGDSIPKPVDILFYVVSQFTCSVVSLEQPAVRPAMLNYGIIEPEVYVISLLCLWATAAGRPAGSLSETVQEYLKEIILEGLTTIPLPRTFVRSTFYYNSISKKVNRKLALAFIEC